MRLPLKNLLKSCKYQTELKILFSQADEVLRTWQPTWTPFLSAPVLEEAMKKIASLAELKWQPYGGHIGAERKRLRCSRDQEGEEITEETAPIKGLQLEGNFLFDTPSPSDIRQAIEKASDIESGDLGDIWVCGDRGAQAFCTKEVAPKLHGRIAVVREMKITCKISAINQLNVPYSRKPKLLSTVEASSRLDSIASAGFGLSRSKIVNQIKEGKLRLNWETIRQPSQGLVVGDSLQLLNRGSVKVLSIEPTKKQRWRIEILRS